MSAQFGGTRRGAPGTLVASLRAGVAFVRVVVRPDRLEHVIAFVDALARLPAIVQPMIDEIQKTPYGAKALASRIRVGRVDLEALERLPEGTLGRAFAEHLTKNGLDPDALPARPARDDAAYISAHMYETHDVWHAVTGFGADEAGELGLQAFYLAQLPSRIAVGILAMGMVQTLFRGFGDRDARMEQIVRGWRMGKAAAPLLGVDWASLWSAPLERVRADLRVAIV